MAIRPSKVDTTSILTSDAAVKAGPGLVFWIAASAGATGGAFQISDALDDSNDVFSAVMPATSVVFFGPFDPPIVCATGIYADIPGTNVTLTVGYQ
jgi:hypothetical protein